mgnify:CR=1 FL=1
MIIAWHVYNISHICVRDNVRVVSRMREQSPIKDYSKYIHVFSYY